MIQRWDDDYDDGMVKSSIGDFVLYTDLLASLFRVRAKVATRERSWTMPPKSDRTEGRRAEDTDILAIIDEAIKEKS
jgi:hypothetical protein